MRIASFRGLFLCLSALSMGAIPAGAWGVLGHQVIASLAEDMLTPKAKAEVVKILAPAGGSTSLASISVWADDVKSLRPNTRAWHYITIQIKDTGAKADPARADTPNVVTALERQLAILRKPAADRYAREEALKWVVHLVGDLHQPLHAGEDRDKGGNLMQVRVNRRAHNLHAVWDYVLLERLKLPADSLRLLLEREIAAEPIWLDRNAQGTPRDWAKASHALAAACYLQHGKPLRKGIKQQLERDYLREATLTSLSQIKLAGARLAFALNEALDSGGFGTGLPRPGGKRPGADDYFANTGDKADQADPATAADGDTGMAPTAGQRGLAGAGKAAGRAAKGANPPDADAPPPAGEDPGDDGLSGAMRRIPESQAADREPAGAKAPGTRAEEAAPAGAAPRATKKAPREALPTVVYKRYAWSANSGVYHYSICADVRRILRKNLHTEDQAPANRELHPGCPVP